jgi:hypothetical protein
MRIKEVILDAIISTRLFEMAFQRKHAIDIALSQSYQTDIHLLKVLMYERVRDYNHWCDEINSCLKKVQSTKLKTSKKPLDFDTLYEILWEGYLETPDEVRDLMSSIDSEYSKSYKLINYDYFEVHKKLQSILYHTCQDIALTKFKDIGDYL